MLWKINISYVIWKTFWIGHPLNTGARILSIVSSTNLSTLGSTIRLKVFQCALATWFTIPFISEGVFSYSKSNAIWEALSDASEPEQTLFMTMYCSPLRFSVLVFKVTVNSEFSIQNSRKKLILHQKIMSAYKISNSTHPDIWFLCLWFVLPSRVVAKPILCSCTFSSLGNIFLYEFPKWVDLADSHWSNSHCFQLLFIFSNWCVI